MYQVQNPGLMVDNRGVSLASLYYLLWDGKGERMMSPYINVALLLNSGPYAMVLIKLYLVLGE